MAPTFSFMTDMGAPTHPDMAPHTPNARRAPAMP
jgi:hypothetical protein